MTPRERLRLALSHKEPDRVPIDLGASIVTSITKAAYVPLRAHLGLPAEEVRIYDEVQQLPYVGEDLLERFRVDTRMVQLPPTHVAGVEILDDGDYWAMIDRWGSRMHMPKADGLYYDWVSFPIEPSLAALDTYRWPEPDPPAVVATLGDQARRLHETTDYALVGSGVIGGGIFEQGCRTVGLEDFMMALVLDRPFAERLMDGITEIYIESIRQYLDAVGEFIDVFTFWDDVCGQSGWLISPDLYVSLIKPRQRRVFDAIRRGTDARIFYHGCGAVFDLIPHLSRSAWTSSIPCRSRRRAWIRSGSRQRYGNDVTFWGGGVDTQRVLPFGTPDACATRSGAGSTISRRAAGSCSTRSTTSRRSSRRRTSSPRSTRRSSTAATTDAPGTEPEQMLTAS